MLRTDSFDHDFLAAANISPEDNCDDAESRAVRKRDIVSAPAHRHHRDIAGAHTNLDNSDIIAFPDATENGPLPAELSQKSTGVGDGPAGSGAVSASDGPGASRDRLGEILDSLSRAGVTKEAHTPSFKTDGKAQPVLSSGSVTPVDALPDTPTSTRTGDAAVVLTSASLTGGVPHLGYSATAMESLTVTTDKADYAPGSTATLVVTGVNFGSPVAFRIADLASDPGINGIADIYAPFSVTDGGLGDTDGLANGVVVTQWQVPADGRATGATLQLTATSGSRTATTTFSDAPSKVALENQKTGNPMSEWGIHGDIETPGDTNIEGFATQMSVNIGSTVDFKINTNSKHYRIDIYRLGYYGGDGARKIATIDKQLASAQIQPNAIVDPTLGLVDAGNWAVSASWQVPTTAVSGVYFAKLTREDGTSGENIIPFIVRDDTSNSAILFQTSDTTWQAYNDWGGANLYGGNGPAGRAYAVSYNRPFQTTTSIDGGPWDFIFGVEYPAIRWLERNGYDISYISGVDTARSGNLLLGHKAFLSVGHDEYWSGEQRTNVEAARDAGVNLAFWSGNEVYWKTRWQTSIDGSGTPFRTMVTYKETWAGTDIDPSSTSTGTWRDPRFTDPGQQPENALTGTMFQVDSYRLDTIKVPYDMSNLRFWRNTSIANVQPGQTGSLVPNLLGYEWDSDVDNGFRPAGLVDLSLSNVSVDTYLYDYGTDVRPGNATHSLTMYRDDSGALVFSAGSVYWSWGLDDNHAAEPTPVDPNVQQAMVNMFADMGIQPTTLQASLILATGSTDHTAPTSTVTSPTIGASFVEGQRVTITGTAQDLGGGLVAGIEVSVDDGQTWRKATGTTSWSYSWIAQASGTYKIKARATDDSLNTESPASSTQVTVSLPQTSSLWTFANKPTLETTLDRSPVELGVRFQASTTGTITGIRFYKGFYNVSSHRVDLWSSSGALLASGISTGETASGWQTVNFTAPVRIQAGTTYVASYHTDGYYSTNDNYFTTTYTNGFLSVQQGGGVYGYGAAGTFPTGSYSNQNYWVDAVFAPDPNQIPVATNDSGFITGQNGPLIIQAGSLLLNDTDPNGDPLSIASVSNAVNGSVIFDSQSNAIIFTPTTNYTGPASFNYTISDGRGGVASAMVSLTVQQGAVISGSTLFLSTDKPAVLSSTDPNAVELGVKFTVSSGGTITGLRYFKSAKDTGTHVGSLWTSAGSLLTSATFTNETQSGWQTVIFANPISVSANTTYVASYQSNGFYAVDSNYFGTDHVSGLLTAPSSTASGGNGIYNYGVGNNFPNNSYNASNYWIDVIYNQAPNVTPVAAADSGFLTGQDTPYVIDASILLANDSDADGDPLTVTDVSNFQHGTASLDLQNKTVTFTPTAGYTGPASFDYTISDGRGGVASAMVSLTVQQGAVISGSTLFLSSDKPAVLSSNDPNAVELGVKFTVSSGGTITGLRYYKSAKDTGTHIGSLWTSTGTLLTTATFTNETQSGWQTVIFANPISVSANTTYVASYQSNGFYPIDGNYFSTNHVSGPLTAPSSTASGGNGVYIYGTSNNDFPSNSYNASNYWVDVIYNPAPNVNPVAVADSGFSTTQNTPIVIDASALLANDSDPDGDPLTVTDILNVQNGTANLDLQSKTVTFTPTAGFNGLASFDYKISDGRGGTATAGVSLTVNPPSQPQSFFGTAAVPSTPVVNDPSPVELGMRFQSDVAGNITAISFYKGSGNTGPHEAHLWTATGTLLASANFTNETASGWQTVNLTQPVPITANTTYVVSYHSNGNYSVTGNFFTTDLNSGNLHALSSGSGGNGVYAYGSSGTFPSNTFNRANYYVDVAFQPPPLAGV
jgi:hypothetical protein